VAAGTLIAAALAQVDLFSVLTPDELEGLSERVRRRRYPKDAVIFLEGDPGTSLYMIEAGRAKMVLSSPGGKEVVIATRGPGEFFGDMALLDGEPHSADAVATEECQLLILRREDFVRFLDAHPKIALRLLALLSRRLRQTMRRQQEATLLDVSARLASALLRLAEERGAAPAGGEILVAAPPTQADLAVDIGATRESVNKWLRYYARRGWIRWDKGHLALLQPEKLRERLA
jgi:CRP-like cAMP-binding protein